MAHKPVPQDGRLGKGLCSSRDKDKMADKPVPQDGRLDKGLKVADKPSSPEHVVDREEQGERTGGKKSREQLNLNSDKISLFPQTTTKRHQGQNKNKTLIPKAVQHSFSPLLHSMCQGHTLAVAVLQTMMAGTPAVAGTSSVNFSRFLVAWTQLVSALQF